MSVAKIKNVPMSEVAYSLEVGICTQSCLSRIPRCPVCSGLPENTRRITRLVKNPKLPSSDCCYMCCRMSSMWQKESGGLNSALPHLSTGFDALHLLLGTEMADIAAATQCVHYPIETMRGCTRQTGSKCWMLIVMQTNEPLWPRVVQTKQTALCS